VVVTLLCTHRVRLQKARVDKRQRKYAKFLGKWWKEEYGAVASADERKKATEVIETVFLFFFLFNLLYFLSVRKGVPVPTRVIVRCGVRACSAIFSMGLHAGIRGKFLWWVSRTDGGWLVFSFN
jgi:hypothetical protein